MQGDSKLYKDLKTFDNQTKLISIMINQSNLGGGRILFSLIRVNSSISELLVNHLGLVVERTLNSRINF